MVLPVTFVLFDGVHLVLFASRKKLNHGIDLPLFAGCQKHLFHGKNSCFMV